MTCLMLSHRLSMRHVKEGRRHLFMPMTMTQKILAAHAGQDEVRPGQLIMAELDGVLGNDKPRRSGGHALSVRTA